MQVEFVSCQYSLRVGNARCGGWLAHARCWVLRDRAGCLRMVRVDLLDPFSTPGCVGEGYRPYFENYTVDASILDSGLSGLGSIEAQGCLRVFLQIIEICNLRIVVS